jgi:transcriptional regulator with XRE-family HTH domain
VNSHPEDEQRREDLVAELRKRRMAAGISAAALGRAMGYTYYAVRAFETRHPVNPKPSTLVAYGEPLGLTLRMDLEGLPDLAPTRYESTLLATGFLGNATAEKLEAVAAHLGASRPRASDQYWLNGVFYRIDSSGGEPLLGTLQRLARCLGGVLVPSWEELP